MAAFFAGIGAVTSSVLAIWFTKRSAHKDCDERMAAYKEGLHELRDE